LELQLVLRRAVQRGEPLVLVALQQPAVQLVLVLQPEALQVLEPLALMLQAQELRHRIRRK
jgi:hypothetical protein